MYSIKCIFIISPFFNDIKIYFHSVKINLYLVRNISIIYIFFHSNKIYFYYMNFSLNTFLVSMSGLPFVFKNVRILLSVCKLNNSTRISKSCQEGHYNRELLNHAPASTQLRPPPPSSFQPPSSSFQPPPRSLQHPQRYQNQNIAGN